ncbi:MAG TPA: hypothetical protein VM183_01255 [Burkholderiales bacterium]|nr:hypothetical protein [Burkholderiales bacterium]
MLPSLQNFIKCFVRDSAGQWRCISFATLTHSGRRVQVAEGRVLVKGTRFMNVDLAALLDDAEQPAALQGVDHVDEAR